MAWPRPAAASPTTRTAPRRAPAPPAPGPAAHRHVGQDHQSISDDARKIPGVAAEGALTGRRDRAGPADRRLRRAAEEIASRLKGFTQRDSPIDARRKPHNRATITDRVAKLLGEQPWPGYDEQRADVIATRLDTVDVDDRPAGQELRARPQGPRRRRPGRRSAHRPGLARRPNYTAHLPWLPSVPRGSHSDRKSYEHRQAEARAVPQRGARHRAGAHPRAAVADRDDPARLVSLGLETHLDETRDHAARIEERLQALGDGSNPFLAAVGLAETVVGQVLALGKTPFDLLRGSGGEEKVLKNAKDACATEALEIATYAALERLARSVGDDETAGLAASIRADEEKMLERILREIPKLTEAVVGADVKGRPSYDVTTTGAADAVREAGDATKNAARKTTAATKRTARQARKVPGVAAAEGQIKGAVASEDDLAIARYDALTADEITARLAASVADRPREGRRVRAQEPESRHDPEPHQLAARQRAVAGLRRAHRRRRPGRAVRGRRRPCQAGPLLRARPQEPRRRPQGDRARAQQRVTRGSEGPAFRRVFAVRTTGADNLHRRSKSKIRPDRSAPA